MLRGVKFYNRSDVNLRANLKNEMCVRVCVFRGPARECLLNANAYAYANDFYLFKLIHSFISMRTHRDVVRECLNVYSL